MIQAENKLKPCFVISGVVGALKIDECVVKISFLVFSELNIEFHVILSF